MQPAMLKAWQEAVKFYPYIDALGEKHYYDTNILIVKFYCARWRTGLMVHWSNPNHSYQWQFYPGKPINFPLPLISMISVKLAALKFMTFTNDEEHDLYWSIEATKQYGPKVKKAFPRMFRHIVTLPLEKEITFYTLDDAYKTAMQTLTIEPGKKIFFSYSIINANTGQRSPRYKKEFTPYEVL